MNKVQVSGFGYTLLETIGLLVVESPYPIQDLIALVSLNREVLSQKQILSYLFTVIFYFGTVLMGQLMCKRVFFN